MIRSWHGLVATISLFDHCKPLVLDLAARGAIRFLACPEKADRFTMDLYHWVSDERQEPIWIEALVGRLPPAILSMKRLNRLLSRRGFDGFTESACESFYAKRGRRVCRPEFNFARFWLGSSKASIPNGGLRGGQPIRWPCGRFWVLSWVSRPRITRRFHDRAV
jgi:hypothetical protein